MQVTEEDGGRLNAFAREPRMEVMDIQRSSNINFRLILIGGGLLTACLIIAKIAIS
ncbi:MAG: high light inducible protein [Prochlorococcaceae cyanobacterium ETNP14_MAG_4]|jgi:hypothetical protein|nr:high light inducible protein [Prochlorococcaceae cyanobacterium ETNP14_MAG_4]